MAYQGRKVFIAGQVLTASDVNSTVDQTVMVFANTSARTTAIPTPTEGMLTYLEDSNIFTYWTGTAWQPLPKLTPEVSAKTANYTLVIGDRGEFITASGTFTITIPSATFAAGDRVDFVNIGTGVITFAGAGVTVNSIDGKKKIDLQFNGATFFFTSPSAGVLIGALAT